MSAQPYFDDLHEQEDPFGYRSRWYEERKRALLLASLSQRQFARGWELGCSNGVLTEALAARCERLLATDISPRAAFQARRNLAHLPHVQVHCASHPEQWPPGRFDLIVCGEMGYYLGQAHCASCAVALMKHFAMTACWSPAIGCPRSPDARAGPRWCIDAWGRPAGGLPLPRCGLRASGMDTAPLVIGPERGPAVIGVLVPAHNEADSIARCLQSIRVAALHPGLGGEAVEVMVALDACTDATGIICRQHQVGSVQLDARCVGVAGPQPLLNCWGGAPGGWQARTLTARCLPSGWPHRFRAVVTLSADWWT